LRVCPDEFHGHKAGLYDVLQYRAGKVEGVVIIYNECGTRTGSRTCRGAQRPNQLSPSQWPGADAGYARADKVDGWEKASTRDGTEYTTMLANGVKQVLTYHPDKTLRTSGGVLTTGMKREGAFPYVEYQSMA
jgi:hypothetical protein